MEHFISDMSHHFAIPFTNPVLIFALLLFIVLVSPMLLKRINVPSIIGLIIAGVIVGPYGLNLITDSAGVNMFSTIGLMYIMFIVGLELDLKEFKANQNKSVVFGIFTFVIPFLIGYPVCRYLLDLNVYASILTASMFSTHTLVTYPIVSRMGVSKNQAVAITVGGTILTDTAVLIVLAIVINSSQGAFEFQFLLKLLISLVVFSAIVFFIIPIIAKWFFQKMESEKYLHYIFVLFIVFLCGFLAELGGIEPIIGAFAAGLALNKLIPHSSALMNRIEFIGNALFIPIFLISVGMLVDISVVFDGYQAIYIAAVLSVVALVEGLSDEFKYYLVAGAVTGGGLTIIANAPNPAGAAILKSHFQDNSIDPRFLFLGALVPTIISSLCFIFL